MSKEFTVTAMWDADAGVFTTQSDIPGLVVEAETFEEVVKLVQALAPEVIAANLPKAF
jgi:predicted RNase H-like HicB family nuclease